MQQSVLVVDICNTLADINGELEIFTGVKRNVGEYLHPSVTAGFFENNLWIFRNARPLPYAAECLNALATSCRLVYCTARPDVAETVTKDWLKDNKFPAGELLMTRNKVETTKFLDVTAAFDDAPHEILGYQNANIPVMVCSQDYNQEFDNRFSWESLSKSLKTFEILLREGGVQQWSILH